MKLKNVKVGARVQLKEDHPYQSSLKKGMVGTILQNDVYSPYVSWDNFTDGHDGSYCKQTRIKLGLPENSVYSTKINYLKHIKE